MGQAIKAGVSLHGSFRLTTSDDVRDPAWDDFLRRGGHSHVQSSLWGQLKAASGWQVQRVKIEEDGRIVGGAQLLLRSLPAFGSAGYVSKGPVLEGNAPGLYRAMMGEILRFARSKRLRYLILQPQQPEEDRIEDLARCGFERGIMSVGPTATVRLDLSLTEDRLFAEMRTSTRRNIRIGLRSGAIVREGTRADLATFYRLLGCTAGRQVFTPEPPSYYQMMWDVMHPEGDLRLFVLERDSVPVSALIALAFGDSVAYKRAGWSGDLARIRPNETLMWTVIRWAKANGYRYFDFEGIDDNTAKAMVNGLPFEEENSDTYKLNFGGNVVMLGPAYDCFFVGKLGEPARRVAALVQRHEVFDRFAKSLRGA